MTSVLIFAGLLDELEQLLKGIAMMKELTFRTRDYLVSFGECMSTRVFAAYLNKIGVKARQVWKDVDGVLTCDPNIYPNARPVPHLTFEEAAELAYFGAQVLHPLSMRPAREGDIPVRVKNSYNPQAPVQVFAIFEDLGISVDCVATSEVSISLTLDPSKLWSRELIQQATRTFLFISHTTLIALSTLNKPMQELDHVVEELEKIAVVHLLQHRSIISLVGNVQRSSLILEKLLAIVSGSIMCHKFDAILLIPPPQVNISLIVNDDEAKQCVKALHSAFFENGFLSEAEEAEFSGNGTTIPSNISVM
ncbi:hypothetical protein BHE74_00047835 [Ensete ventricosum]|nr:hypothetical protein BHE74_00047835 [Ensete ventricosum]